MNPKIKAIINGSTGIVGEGVLLECLKHPDVESVLCSSYFRPATAFFAASR